MPYTRIGAMPENDNADTELWKQMRKVAEEMKARGLSPSDAIERMRTLYDTRQPPPDVDKK